MVKHATMARSPEKPLTAKALNAFFETVSTGLEGAGFLEITTQDALSEIATKTLPISAPLPEHEALGYVLAASKYRADFDKLHWHNTLPETLGELKDRITDLTMNFEQEPSSRQDAARERFNEIINKAYRAAEKEMSRGAAASP